MTSRGALNWTGVRFPPPPPSEFFDIKKNRKNMETTTFVLGILGGLFLVGIVYAFAGVLRMQKTVKQLAEDIPRIHREIDKKTDSLWRDTEKRFEDVMQYSDHLTSKINEVVSYVDSRIDKSLTHLSKSRSTAEKLTKTVFPEEGD
jgi:gas vesicle protein